MIRRECIGIVVRSILLAASYIHPKTLLQTNVFPFSIAQVASAIMVSLLPNHRLNYPTHPVSQSFDFVSTTCTAFPSLTFMIHVPVFANPTV